MKSYLLVLRGWLYDVDNEVSMWLKSLVGTVKQRYSTFAMKSIQHYEKYFNDIVESMQKS